MIRTQYIINFQLSIASVFQQSHLKKFMTKYIFPNLTKFEIIFNGRRYKAFKVSASSPFNGYEEESNFVVWDGLHDAAVSHGTTSGDGVCSGFLAFSHVEIKVESSPNISIFIKNTSKEQLRIFKDAGT